MEPVNKGIKAVLMGLGIQARKQKARPGIARLVVSQAGLPRLSPPSVQFVTLARALHAARPARLPKFDAHTHTPAPAREAGGGGGAREPGEWSSRWITAYRKYRKWGYRIPAGVGFPAGGLVE